MQNNDNTRKLYDALVADNYELGDYEKFTSDISNPEYMRKLYDTMVADDYELGEYNTFSSRYSVTPQGKAAQATQATARTAQPVVDEYGLPVQPKVSTIEDVPQVESKPQMQTAQQTPQASAPQASAAPQAQTQAQATQQAQNETPWTAEMMALARQHHLKETGEDPITYMPRGYRTGKTGSDDELLAAWFNETEDTRKQAWQQQGDQDIVDYKADRDAVYAEQGKWDSEKAKQWREKMMATYRIDPMQEIPETYRSATEQKWGKKGSDEAVLSAWLNEKENIRQGQWNDQMQTQKQKYMETMKPLSGFEGRERKAILEERKRQIESQLNQPDAVRNAAARTNMAKSLESIDQELQVLNEQQKQWQEQYGSWTPSSARRFREQTMEQTWYDPYGEVPESYKEAATKQWGKKGSEDAYFAAWMNLSPEEREAFVKREHIKELTEGENKERMQTIYERAKSRGNEAGKQMHETFFHGVYSPGQAQGAGNAFAAWQAQLPTTHTLKAIEKANEIIEAYRNHQADENFFIGAFKGMKDGLSDIDNWTGVYMAGEMQNLYAIADKMEKGEALTQDEEDFLDAQAYRLAIEASLAEDLGWGYKSGNTTGASIPFMLQMLASPVSVGAGGTVQSINKGFAAVGKRAIKKFGKTILRRTLAMPKGLEMAGKAFNIAGKAVKPLSKIVGKVADTRAGQLALKGLKATALATEAGVAQAFLFNSDKMAADAMERHLGNEMLAERANEQYGTNLIAKEGEEWVTAIFKAVASMTAEQGSEYLGTTLFEPIGKMIARSGAGREIGDLLSGISGTTLMRAAKNSRAGAALRLLSQVKGSKVLDEIMGKAQWNGLFGEYLEELANGAVSVAIGNIEAEKFASAKHQAETILGLAWTSGALGVLRGGQRVKMYAKAHRLLSDTDRTARLLFTAEDGTLNQEMMDKWEEFKASLEGKDLEGMRAELSRVMDDLQAMAPTQGGVNVHRMRLLMDYMKGYAYLMGISSADNADEQELTAEQEQAETALAEGMTADTALAQLDIVQALAESEKRLGEMLGTEDVDSWLDAMGETAEAQLEALHNDTALPDETKQAAEQYLNDRLRYEGVRTMAEEEVENRVNSAMAEFDQNTNKDTGKLTEVKMKDESTAYVVGGSLEAGGNIYIRYADGRLVHTVASDVVEVLSDQQAQPVRDMMAEGVRQQAVAEIAARMQAEQQRRQAEATRHSIPADETVPAEETVAPTESAAPVEEAATEDVAVPVETAATEESAPREDADYEAMTPEEAVDDLWARTQEDEEVMDGSIQDTIEQMQQRLAEAEAAPIAAGANMTERIANRQAHNAAVAQAKASLEHWQKIAAMAEQRKAERAAQTQAAEELNQQLERQRQQEEQQRLQEEQQRLQEEQARIEREQKAAEQKAHAEEVQANMEQYIAEAEAHNSKHDVREISRQTGVEAKRIKRILDWAAEHGVKVDFENYTTTGKHGQGQMTNASIYSGSRRIVLNKGVLSDGTAIEFIAGHELTHQAKADGNMEAWENLRKATIEAMGQERYDREFERTKRLYRQAYKNMSEQELNAAIEEEVVADWSGMIFLDPEAIDKMRNVPKTFAQKVHGWLKGFFYGDTAKQVKDAISAWQQLAEGKELTEQTVAEARHSIVGVRGAEALDKAEGVTVRMDNLDVAHEMDKAGKDAETIWLATGWEKGADGKWRYEVLEDFAYEEPRAKAERLAEEKEEAENEKEKIYRLLDRFPARGLTDAQKAKKKELNQRLKELIKKTDRLSDELMDAHRDKTVGELIGTDNNIIKAYPELADLPVSFIERDEYINAGYKGSFDGTGIWISPYLEDTASTLLHELQHAIQRIEGFARGGNTDIVQTKAEALKQDVRPLHELMLETPEWAEKQRLATQYFDLLESNPEEAEKVWNRISEIDQSGVLKPIQSMRTQLKNKYGSNATVGKILSGPYAEDAEIWNELPSSFNDRYEAYRSLAGETEARNVQSRLNMSEEERKAKPLSATEDVERGEQVVKYSITNKEGEQLEETANATRYSIVVDPQLIAELEASPKRKGYRNVVQREDEMFEAPMGNSLRGNGITVENTPFAMGQWEQSEEHPELVYGDNKITLVKPDGKTVADVNYNPYIHNRLNTLNAQFKQAWERPDLVYIETEVPVTDLEGGYMADKAHLSTGVHQWSNGALMLSRYDKPVRIVPWDEVAIPWIDKYKKSGVHFDIVPPALRSILTEAGVEILPPHKGMGKNCVEAYEEWKKTAKKKNNENPIDNDKVSELGQPTQIGAPLANLDAKVRIIPEITKGLDGILDLIKKKGQLGAHEFLHELSKAFSRNKDKGGFSHSEYYDLHNGITLRLADHYSSAETFKKNNNFEKNYGLVIKLSKHKFTSSNEVDYIEYVYYPDKITKQLQEEIIEGLKDFVATGNFDSMPKPDKTNLSKRKVSYSITPEYKQKQLDVIKQSNPAEDDYHTWIRSVDDIKSFEEALSEDEDYNGEDFDPSYTWDMAEDALQSGEITVYSSKPIANGNFVTPSTMEAEAYAGDGRIYMATLPLQDIAWIDPTQGQVAKVEGDVMFSIPVYHGSGAKFDKFDHAFMGSGEGNQAFGWGTYVSEVEGIAKAYADQSRNTMLTYKGQEIDTEGFDNPWRIIKDLYADHQGKLRDMRNRVERILGMVEEDNTEMKALWQNVVDVLKQVRSGDLKMQKDRNLYDVEIPDDNGDNYLSWYGPVQKEKQMELVNDLYNELLEIDAEGAYESEVDKLELKEDLWSATNEGKELYGWAKSLGGARAASEFFSEHGYVGIKFPAESLSGGRSDNAKNYVIFNEADAQIVDHRRFSIADLQQQLDDVQKERGEFMDAMAEKYGSRIWFSTPKAVDGFEEDMARRKEYSDRIAEIKKSIEALEAEEQIKAREENTNKWRAEEERKQKLFDTAKEEYGVTNDFALAGYMLPDGELLDFSHDGVRDVDHRSVEGMYPDVEHEARWDYVVDFMNDGAIRIMPESATIEMTQQPTAEQRKKLKEYIRQENGYVIVEINDANGNSQAYKEYDEGTAPNKVLADIDRYFDEGIRFSLSAEEQSIIDAAKANGTYMKAPNGESSNLNEEQWAQVRTKAFKEWFGDWENDPENASKIVDENGEPRVMYHGSSWRPLQEEDGNAVFKMQDGALGEGAYFTSSFPEAADYVRDKLDNWEMSEDEIDEGGYVTEVFLNIRDDKQILRDNAYGNDSFIAAATSPNQIKSATENNGEFSGENDDIRYSIPARLQQLQKAENFIRQNLQKKRRGKSFGIDLPVWVEKQIIKALGRDFDSHNITINGVVHGLNNHGVNGKKLTSNSIPITEENATLIPYIMVAPDKVVRGSVDSRGRDSIQFIKNLSNGVVVVVEKEYTNSPNDMETINIWADLSSEAINAQRKAAPDTNVQNAILDIDVAKIRKDAEEAIKKDVELLQKQQNVTPTEQNGDKKFSLRFSNGLDWDGLHDAIQEYTDYSNGAYSLLAKLEEEYGGEIIGASSGARLAIENDGLVPSSKGPGENMEYHHVAFLDKDGNEFVKAVPFVKPETVAERMGVRFSLTPISGRGVNESFIDYANRVAREVERQRNWQRMGLNRVLARDQYEERVASGWYQTQEALQDSMLGLKALMESIAGKGIHIEDIPDFENPYLGENRLSSVNQAESEMFARMFIKPMLEEITKLARNEQEREILTNYAMAKHGLERNLMMATRDAQRAFADPNNTETLLDLFNKFRKKDYAGLTGLTGKKTVAAAEQEAQQMVDDYEQAHNTDELWAKIDAVNDAILLKQKECGLLGEKMYQEIRAMYDYYIPLRGFDEETIVDAYAYLDNRAMGEGSVVQRAQGRKSKADNPWAYLQSMADQTIMQGNRNKLVKEKLLTFVTNHPSDAVSLSRVWMQYDPSTRNWEVMMPRFLGGETSEEVAAAWEELDREISELAEQHPDLYKTGKETLNLPFKVPDEKMLKEHQVLVRTGAGLHIITINGSPRAAQAVNGQTNPDKPTGTLGALVNWLEGVNRFMSQMYTSNNPDFIYSNWIRDSIYGNSMMWVKESPAYARRFNANWAKYNPKAVRRLLIKYKEGTLDMNNYTEALFNDFMMNGGETGYSIVHDIEAHKTAIKKEMQKLSGDGGTREAIGALLEKIEDISRAVENATRFAAFVTSMEEGRGIGRSVWDAKEVSVNFNKKGAGDKFWKANGQTKAGNAAAFMSGFGRMAYIFWNAALQGTTNTGRQVKRHPVKALSALAVNLALGYLVALAGTWDGDDDEEKTGEKELGYLDLPEYTRRSNMVIKTVKGHWLTIPLPIEYRALYGLGELAGVLMSGKQEMSGGDITMAVAQQLTQVLPVDMLSGNNGWLPFVPSALSPLAQVLSNNKWTGQSLWYEPEDKTRAEMMPEWAKAYKGTDRYLVAMTKALSNITGGDDVQGGMLDLNPAAIETLLDGHFGAISTMSKNLVKSIEMAAGVREYDPRYIPIWRRMVAAENEQTQNYSVNADYRELKETYDAMLLKMRGYQRKIDDGREDYEEKLEKLENSDEGLVYEIFETYKDDIKFCTDELREAEKEDDKEALEKAQAEFAELKREIVEEVRAARRKEKDKKKEGSE